tara:strand:- start:40 stop:738 length:699 start_codon:yes stop_codon:yes gene_type:complete
MEKFDAGCLIDAKKEYTQRLIRKLKTPVCSKIMEIFKNVKGECSDYHINDKTLLYFQEKLEKIPEWNDLEIQEVTREILMNTQCDYLEELLQAVFIVHTKILSVIQPPKSNAKLELKMPSIDDFIFQSFINAAREIWKFAYLFKDVKDSCQYQKNNNLFENKIEDVLKYTIEDMLPVRDLLVEHVKDYIMNDDDDDDDNEEESNKKKKILSKKLGGYSTPEDNTLNTHSDST